MIFTVLFTTFEITHAKQEHLYEKYKTVIETLKMGLDDTQMTFDTTDLEIAITSRKADINTILKEIAKYS